MKKLILLLAIAGFFTQAQAQKLMAKDVPAAVTAAFYQQHPLIKDIDWSKDGNNFEAGYNSDKTEMSATYDATGILVETEIEIAASALPAAATEYLNKNYNQAAVKESSKITSAAGAITYEAEVNGMDLTFDSKGNFIKSEKI